MKFLKKMITKIKGLFFKPKLKLNWKSNTYIFTAAEIEEINRVVNANLKVRFNTTRIGDYIYGWYKD